MLRTQNSEGVVTCALCLWGGGYVNRITDNLIALLIFCLEVAAKKNYQCLIFM